MPTPLFPLLLGPLREREKPYLERTLHKQEDLGFVEGLLGVLEHDLASGLRPTAEQAQAWAEHLTMELHPPRLQPGDNTLPRVDLALPTQPWQDTPGDPRERLLARLVHLGANPWLAIDQSGNGLQPGQPGDNNYRARFLGESLASTWLEYGYTNLSRLAMDMPHQVDDYLRKGPHRSYEQGHLAMHQQAAYNDNYEILARMIANGGSIQNTLLHAQSVPVVELLLAQGADLGDGAVVQHWLKKHSAKTVRALIQATEQHMTPQSRLKQALGGKAWGAVNDSLEAWENWQEQTLPLGKAALRVNTYALATCTINNPTRILHALRILAKQPASDRDSLPGVSEKALVRLLLHALSPADAKQKQVTRQTEAEKVMVAKLIQHLNSLGGDAATLQADAKAFLHAAAALHDTACARRLANTILGRGLVLPQERAGQIGFHYGQRTADDMELLGKAARCMWTEEIFYGGTEDSFTKLFGLTPNDLKDHGYGFRPNDPRRTWLPRMLAKHPERMQTLTTAALHMLGAGISQRFYQPKGDPWAPLCQQLDDAMANGGLADIPRDEGRRLLMIAGKCTSSAGAPAFGVQLQAKLEQVELNATTAPARSASGRPRF